MSPDGAQVFVAGSLDDDYFTVAHDAETGFKIWSASYDGPGWADAATSIAVHPDGWTVFVSGMSVGVASDYDFFTIAYSLDF